MNNQTKKTNEQIYLEWVNDYLTTKEMANSYNMTTKELEKIIDKGRDEHLLNVETKEYIKFWGIGKL